MFAGYVSMLISLSLSLSQNIPRRRTGFWKEHLGNRPYHISALFVVDLVAFRRCGEVNAFSFRWSRYIYDEQFCLFVSLFAAGIHYLVFIV